MLCFNHLVTCSSRNNSKPPSSKPRSVQRPVHDCKMQKRYAKEKYLQSSVNRKFRSPLRNVRSHAHLRIHPIFKTCAWTSEGIFPRGATSGFKSRLKASLAVWRNLLPYIFQGGLQPGSPSRRAAPVP